MVYGSDNKLLYMLTPEGTVSRSEGSAGTSYTYNYFKTDHLGSTRVMLSAVDRTLQASQTTDFYPFGLAFEYSNLNKNKYLFSGKELQDGLVGSSMLEWYDFGARFYDPVLGRWFNVDPAAQVANPYLFCGNAPMMYIDKDGRLAWFVPIIIGAVIGGISNVAVNWDKIGNFWQGFKFFGIGAVVGGAAGYAGYGAGLAVSNALGVQTGALYGATVGAASGAASGTVSGAGMAWANGASLQDGLIAGLKSGLIGGAIGMATGGVLEGVRAARNGMKFFSGQPIRPQNNYTPVSISQEEARELLKRSLNDDGLVKYKPMSPYEKGQQGMALAAKDIKAQGHTVLGKEVSYRVEGSNVGGRIDYVTKGPDGKIYFHEVKNGPHAGFTTNQKINYPLIEQKMSVTPHGNNALDVPKGPITPEMKYWRYNSEPVK